MDVQLKTASFGGYDKKAVETYIEELQASHEKEVADLKANVMKLSETVKNLHTMREVNLNESSSTIDNLKKVNEELQDELSQLKEKMENYKLKEEESASRYESISRTLLEARESADHLTRQTEQECEAKKAETQTACDQLTSDTTAECERMLNETTEECERLQIMLTARNLSVRPEKRQMLYVRERRQIAAILVSIQLHHVRSSTLTLLLSVMSLSVQLLRNVMKSAAKQEQRLITSE